MEENPSPESNHNHLHKCPHCMCHFCTEADLKRHLDAYGANQAEHAAEFQRAHGRLEHGASNGPE